MWAGGVSALGKRDPPLLPCEEPSEKAPACKSGRGPHQNMAVLHRDLTSSLRNCEK